MPPGGSSQHGAQVQARPAQEPCHWCGHSSHPVWDAGPAYLGSFCPGT